MQGPGQPAQHELRVEPTGQSYNDGSTQDDLQELADLAANDVVAQLPRYAAPNIASALPAYRNGEQEFIQRTFATGNYDMIRHLPASLKEQQVHAARTARQEATRSFLMPALGQPRLRSDPANQQGLFQAFEYIPSRYSLASELASKERVAHEATRLAVGRGQEFIPTVAPRLQKHQDVDPSVGYAYLSGPEELDEDARRATRLDISASAGKPVFVPPGTQKLAEAPTRAAGAAMMRKLKQALEADWEGAEIGIFENEHDCWVISFQEASVDSTEGLAAYMNVFVRTNPLANEYRLTRVVEFWASRPGDGYVYYVLRPPWVAADKLDSFFALHPEERDWRTSFPVVEMEKERQARKQALDSNDDSLELQAALAAMGLQQALHEGAGAGGPGQGMHAVLSTKLAASAAAASGGGAGGGYYHR